MDKIDIERLIKYIGEEITPVNVSIKRGYDNIVLPYGMRDVSYNDSVTIIIDALLGKHE